jgi:hypothetical protein
MLVDMLQSGHQLGAFDIPRAPLASQASEAMHVLHYAATKMQRCYTVSIIAQANAQPAQQPLRHPGANKAGNERTRRRVKNV